MPAAKPHGTSGGRPTGTKSVVPEGAIFGRVNGGFTAPILAALFGRFLPGSKSGLLRPGARRVPAYGLQAAVSQNPQMDRPPVGHMLSLRVVHLEGPAPSAPDGIRQSCLKRRTVGSALVKNITGIRLPLRGPSAA